MKKYYILLSIILFISIFINVRYLNETKVYLNVFSPTSRWLQLDKDDAKEFLDAYNNVYFEECELLNNDDYYYGYNYAFKIVKNGKEQFIGISEFGVMLKNDKFYVISKFDEILDKCRILYGGIIDTCYLADHFNMYNMSEKEIYLHSYVDFQKHFPDEVFVNGDCTISEITSWYDDTIDINSTVNEYFMNKGMCSLNDFIELQGNYHYVFKKISVRENVYLLKCDGPMLEELFKYREG